MLPGKQFEVASYDRPGRQKMFGGLLDRRLTDKRRERPA
jgi:hypothetical protein